MAERILILGVYGQLAGFAPMFIRPSVSFLAGSQAAGAVRLTIVPCFNAEAN